MTKQYDPAVERDFTEAEQVNLCVMCTLADAMKPCMHNQPCSFAIGRAVREVVYKTIDMQDKGLDFTAFWISLPDWLWEAYYAYLCDHNAEESTYTSMDNIDCDDILQSDCSNY